MERPNRETDTIKIKLFKIKRGMDLFCSGQGSLVWSCEHGSEILSFIKYESFFFCQMRD